MAARSARAASACGDTTAAKHGLLEAFRSSVTAKACQGRQTLPTEEATAS